MSIERRWFLGAAGLLLTQQALAQLSSPLGTPPARSDKPVNPPASGAQGSIPMGSGAGVHSPNSPFAPLPKRDDVLAWSLLTAVTTQKKGTKLLPKFGEPQLALDQKTQRVQGFMMPLEPGDRQRHFLLTSVPLTCSFCLPGGPESMVEVRARTPVKYTLEPVVVEGRFAVLLDDPYGLYYRITDGVAVK